MAKTEFKKIARPFEIKQLDDATGYFEGYASVFGVEDSYRDVVVQGAFTRTLAEHKAKGSMPKMLWQHDPEHPVGVFTDMMEDSRGLFVKGTLLLDVEKGREGYALLKHKAIDAMSIGYSTKRYEVVKKSGDEMDGVRRLLDVDLWEVSLVTFPANDRALVTGVKEKHTVEELPTEREFERWLTREAGFSRSEAVTIIRDGFKSLLRKRDAVEVDDTMSVLLEAVKSRSKVIINH